MNLLKRIMGLLWMITAPVVIYLLITGAIQNVKNGGKPIPWVIMIAVSIPIAIGLVIFGYYAFKGEYDRLPESSEEL